jgi:alpha-L-arabinofuranosidase
MDAKIKWGIIGTGNISGKFAHALNMLPDANLVAGASRDRNTARVFAKKHEIPKAYGTCQELADDPTIDVVNIGTPQTFHLENSVMCMKKGKSGTRIQLMSDDLNGVNSIDQPFMIAPSQEQFTTKGKNISMVMAAYSFSVFKIPWQ